MAARRHSSWVRMPPLLLATCPAAATSENSDRSAATAAPVRIVAVLRLFMPAVTLRAESGWIAQGRCWRTVSALPSPSRTGASATPALLVYANSTAILWRGAPHTTARDPGGACFAGTREAEAADRAVPARGGETLRVAGAGRHCTGEAGRADVRGNRYRRLSQAAGAPCRPLSRDLRLVGRGHNLGTRWASSILRPWQWHGQMRPTSSTWLFGNLRMFCCRAPVVSCEWGAGCGHLFGLLRNVR